MGFNYPIAFSNLHATAAVEFHTALSFSFSSAMNDEQLEKAIEVIQASVNAVRQLQGELV